MKFRYGQKDYHIQKKHSFFSYYNRALKVFGGVFATCFIGFIAITNWNIIIRILNPIGLLIVNGLTIVSNIITNILGFETSWSGIIIFGICYFIATPYIVIYIMLSLINVAKYFYHHLYIPLSHEELELNNIKTFNEYQFFIRNFFIGLQPLKRARKDIQETCMREFEKEMSFHNNLQGRTAGIENAVILSVGLMIAINILYMMFAYYPPKITIGFIYGMIVLFLCLTIVLSTWLTNKYYKNKVMTEDVKKVIIKDKKKKYTQIQSYKSFFPKIIFVENENVQ